MSGHSKWSTIKRKKAVIDSKRGKIFSKLAKELMTAARLGGGQPSANPRLRLAITTAKAQSMPSENISRAIKKGCGELDGPPVEDIIYEGYGAGGVAFIVEASTDNRNRTSADLRAAFAKNSGNLGTSGSVAWMFNQCAQFVFDETQYDEEVVMETSLEIGASDVVSEGDAIIVYAEVPEFGNCIEGFEKAEMVPLSAELTMIPENTIPITGSDAKRVLRLMEKLDDLDDVVKVYANFDIDDAELECIADS